MSMWMMVRRSLPGLVGRGASAASWWARFSILDCHLPIKCRREDLKKVAIKLGSSAEVEGRPRRTSQAARARAATAWARCSWVSVGRADGMLGTVIMLLLVVVVGVLVPMGVVALLAVYMPSFACCALLGVGSAANRNDLEKRNNNNRHPTLVVDTLFIGA